MHNKSDEYTRRVFNIRSALKRYTRIREWRDYRWKITHDVPRSVQVSDSGFHKLYFTISFSQGRFENPGRLYNVYRAGISFPLSYILFFFFNSTIYIGFTFTAFPSYINTRITRTHCIQVHSILRHARKTSSLTHTVPSKTYIFTTPNSDNIIIYYARATYTHTSTDACMYWNSSDIPKQK